MALLAGPSAAIKAQEHSHEPLVATPALDYHQVLATAVEHAPERLAGKSRQGQSDAYRRLGSSWVPAGPRASVNYLDDRAHDNLGMMELEARLEWQLWGWGARRDSRQLADGLDREVDAWRKSLELAVAGRLRTAMADLREADLQLEQSRVALDQARQLREIADRQVRAGDVARDALLQAEMLELELRNQVMDKEALLVDAQRSYQFLTGLTQRPEMDLVEEKAGIDEITQQHPLLVFMQTRLDVARSHIAAVRHESRGSPTISLGMKRQRGNQLEEYADSLVAGVSYPLGGGSLASARVSDATLAASDIQVEYELTRRDLQQQLHETEHSLHVIEEQIPLARRQAEIAGQRADMARQAFEVGETNMTQVVLALRQSQEQETRQRLLVLQRDRLISQLNQTVGVLP